MRSDRLNIAFAHTNNEVIVNHNNGFDFIKDWNNDNSQKTTDMIYKTNLYQQNKIIPISYNKTRGNLNMKLYNIAIPIQPIEKVLAER